MKRILQLTLVALGLSLPLAPTARADRLGGPATEIVTVRPYGTAVFEVTFLAGRPAVVTMEGDTTNVDLLIHDGDGNTSVGRGVLVRKTAVMNVYREGVFRVEVRNYSGVAHELVLRTN